MSRLQRFERIQGPKGRHILAQGRAFFASPWGARQAVVVSPERATQRSRWQSVMPFQGSTLVSAGQPRATQKTLCPGLVCDGLSGQKAGRVHQLLVPSLLSLLLLTTAYGQQTSTGQSGTVTLPLEEYNRLLDQAAQPAKTPARPPAPFALSEASLLLKVEDQAARGKIVLRGEVLQAGLVKVPLCGDVAVLAAEAGGIPLPLIAESQSRAAVLRGPARFDVSLDVIIPVQVEAGRAGLTIPAPSAGTVRLNLDLPGDHTNVRLQPGLVTARSAAGSRTLLEATLVPGSPSTVFWATRETPALAVAREIRYVADVKTLVSVGEVDLRMTILTDVTVVQSDPDEFQFPVPEGFEVTETAGNTLRSTEARPGSLVLKTTEPGRRSHQFLVSMERSLAQNEVQVPLVGFKDAQRETGEILVEGAGTMELNATESGELRRMDVREVNPALRSLARSSLQAAFRFTSRSAAQNRLTLTWTRFPDAPGVPAAAERAEATTLVTSEGKTLTEVTLTVRNESQPFLKVGLPPGASLLSAEVSGEKVKPVEGTDGTRVPLLRTGFRPEGPYVVSFVFFNPGVAFNKSGTSELALPRLDVPVNLMLWEVFLPDRFAVKDFAGNAMPSSIYPSDDWQLAPRLDLQGGTVEIRQEAAFTSGPGRIEGLVTDQAGAVIPGAEVIVTEVNTGSQRRLVTDDQGRWTATSLSSGRVSVAVSLPGFKISQRTFAFDSGRTAHVNVVLEVGEVAEVVEVAASEAGSRVGREAKKAEIQQPMAPSANVSNLQRRVAGVLPIGVDVPRAGKAYRFLRPLVIDEETKVSFKYKVR